MAGIWSTTINGLSIAAGGYTNGNVASIVDSVWPLGTPGHGFSGIYLKGALQTQSIFKGEHVVTAAEQTAAAVNILTGCPFGTTPLIQILRAGVQQSTVGMAIGMVNGTCSLQQVSGAYVITAGDVIDWITG